MATRESTTGAWGFHLAPRPIAPSRLLMGGDLDALLDRPVDIERALDVALRNEDDFDVEPDVLSIRALGTLRLGGRHA